MAMNFWEAQTKAKSKTTLYLIVFILLTIGAAIFIEWAIRALAPQAYRGQSVPPYTGFFFLLITFTVALFNYWQYTRSGGQYVAESMGANLVENNTRVFQEKQLLNLVEEIALATGLPIPKVYIIDANEINAFAAGTSRDNAVIAVTRGALRLLTREELQGVVAHEFGHIYNRDMVIGMRVAAMITGFFVISFIGLRLLGFRREDDRREGGSIALIAILFLVVGSLTWFFGSILQAMVSRQREYLADACSVQYTRNPVGLAGALRKIQELSVSDMPKNGKPYAHLYFTSPGSFWSRLFATHPPLEERIAKIEGEEYTRS